MTSRVIMQFMWGYQEHFRLAFQRLASESLGSLAPTLKIRSLLVGVKSPNAIAHHLVCVEPETGEVPQSLLDGLEKRIQELIASHELQNVFYGDEPSNRDKPRRIREACVRDAVAERLSPFDSTAGIRSFCSLPTVVGSYEVVCVIQVEVNAFNSMPQLRRTTTWHEDFRVVPSLAHAVIECLLEEAHDALYKPEPGRTVRRTFAMDGEGVVLRAAKEFSYTPSWAGKRTDAMGELFEPCCRVAARQYERRDAQASMLLLARDHPALEQLVELERPVPLRATRWARKILQMSSKGIFALCDGAALFGLGRLKGDYDPVNEDAFLVDFRGHGSWDLVHGGTVLMRVLHGVASIPRARVQKEAFCNNLRRVVTAVSEEGAERAWAVVSAAIEQRHGTMVVMSAAGEEEAKRLGGQATVVRPRYLSPDLVECVSEIDRAILVDSTGRCCAVGVVLDGPAGAEGTAARGARYSSAVRYVAGANAQTLAVVISEDGDVDMIPLLKSQIRPSDLSAILEEVGRLRDSPTSDGIRRVMKWLDAHRFYLSAEQCAKMNAAMKEFDEFIEKERELWICYARFTPDASMNESYFLEE